MHAFDVFYSLNFKRMINYHSLWLLLMYVRTYVACSVIVCVQACNWFIPSSTTRMTNTSLLISLLICNQNDKLHDLSYWQTLCLQCTWPYLVKEHWLLCVSVSHVTARDCILPYMVNSRYVVLHNCCYLSSQSSFPFVSSCGHFGTAHPYLVLDHCKLVVSLSGSL